MTETTDPENFDSLHRMMPALGLTTVHVDKDQAPGGEFAHTTVAVETSRLRHAAEG